MTGVPLNIDLQQILLHLFNFAILFGILYFLLYAPVKKFMQHREDVYRERDEKAKADLQAAADAKAQAQTQLADMADTIQAEKDRSRAQTEAAASARIQAANDEAARIITNAKEEAEREKEKIISDAQSDISDMVTAAAEKLALAASASDAFDQFLDAAEAAEGRSASDEQ